VAGQMAPNAAIADDARWWWDSTTRSPVRDLGMLGGLGAPGRRTWSPADDQVHLLPAARLLPIGAAPLLLPSRLALIAAAARINDAIARQLLLAPLDAAVIPLPHQIDALHRAMSADPVRVLLADEVGLGKTIEAGLIIRELKLRGLARRILIVAPKGLTTQWVAELSTHFDEQFALVLPGDPARHPSTAQANHWRHFDQVITAMDTVKPLAAREGWSAERLARHNEERFGQLVGAGWDLIVVDEAHRLAGTTESVARYELGQGLAGAARHLLLLSATPHNGKSDAFHRLMALLDGRAFPTPSTVSRERVRPYVIRTEKRSAVDIDGRPLFMPRTTRTIAVAWDETSSAEQGLYDAVTDYVREGYNRAVRERRYAVGFLLLLFQRLVTSSTRAILNALERRHATLSRALPPDVSGLVDAQRVDEDDDDAVAQLLGQTVSPFGNERAEVQTLLDLARQTVRGGQDAKARRLLRLLADLEREELDPQLKLLVFTEFTATQAMLAEVFAARGYTVATLHGGLSLDERRRVQESFTSNTRVLISTEAGGEGLNLQFCHLIVNYDLPWNPMRIEQRIGRVDRIGQRQPVRAFNFTLQSSIDGRMRDVLEEKLQRILEDLGVDKLGDVLDSGDVETDFERLYVTALLDPDAIGSAVDTLTADLRRRADDARSGAAILSPEPRPDLGRARNAIDHPLPRWVETLAINAVRDDGGAVVPTPAGYDMTWDDDEGWLGVTFTRAGLGQGGDRLITLAEERLQTRLRHGWRQVPGQPIARVVVSALVAGVEGVWSLWEVRAIAGERTYRRYLPLFLHDKGHLLIPSARRVWESLVQPLTTVAAAGQLAAGQGDAAWERLHTAAEEQAGVPYQELVREHAGWLERQEEKLRTEFAARRATAMRVGLASVREHRLTLVDAAERREESALCAARHLLCEVIPLVLVHVEPQIP